MRKLALAGAVTAALGTSAYVASPSLDDMTCATVKIELANGNGSGTVISPRHVLTNHHVIYRADTITVTALISGGGRIYPVKYTGKVVAKDEDRDLALVELDRKWVGSVARLAPVGYRISSGDDIWMAGAPLGKDVHLTKGEVRVVNDISQVNGARVMSTSAFVAWGNSGGGAWRRSWRGWGPYELVGVPQALHVVTVGFGAFVALPNVSYAIPLDRVREFLKASGVKA